jgi:hypothetical protein
MELDSKHDVEIRKIEKITKYQLPNKFKKIGFGLFIASVISTITFSFIIESMNYQHLLDKIVKTVAILGLLLISISREKIEDELIIKLRMQSYSYAFIVGVLFFLIMPFINYGYLLIKGSVLKMEGVSDFTILGTILAMQIYSFGLLKKAYNEE